MVLIVSQITVGIITYLRMNNKHLKQNLMSGECSATPGPQYDFDPRIVNFANLLAILWELGIYISISLYISQMDTQIWDNISEQSQRRRKRRTAITLFGSIAHFALECMTILMSMIFLSTRSSRFLVVMIILIQSNSAIISLALIAMSSTLKNELKNIFVKNPMQRVS